MNVALGGIEARRAAGAAPVGPGLAASDPRLGSLDRAALAPARARRGRRASGRCILCSAMSSLLSIVIPVYNEADSLEPLVAEIDARARPARPVRGRVRRRRLDRRLVRRHAARWRPAHAACASSSCGATSARRRRSRTASPPARGDVVVTMDGDRQDDPAEIPKLLAALDEGYDLVSGWKQSRQDPLSKTLPSRLFNWTVRKHDRHSAARLQLRPQGLPAARWSSTSPSTASCTATSRWSPRSGLSRRPRSRSPTGGARRGTSKYGWRRYLRGYLDLLTVLFLGRYQQPPAAPVRRHRHADDAHRRARRGYLTIDKLASATRSGSGRCCCWARC